MGPANGSFKQGRTLRMEVWNSLSSHSLWIEQKSHPGMHELLLTHAGSPSSEPKHKEQASFGVVFILI